MRHFALTLPLLALLGLAGCTEHAGSGAASTPASAVSTTTDEAMPGPIADDAAGVQPLKVGDAAPTVTVSSPEGTPVALADVYAEGPTMLIFYRGAWCPFCTRHLSDVAKNRQRITDEGVRIVAISPDAPEAAAKMVAGQDYGYTVLADPGHDAITAFGLAFRNRGDVLPVPSVYLVDTSGVIRFAHWNPDYKQRLSTDELIAAVQQAKEMP